MIALTPALLITIGCGALAWRARRERLHPEVVTARATTTFTEYVLGPASLGDWFDSRFWARAYGQYARYDARYLTAQPTVVFICFTEVVLGPLCLLLAWLIQRDSPFRHPLQLVLCTAQFYGTVLYFVEPMVAGTWSEVMTQDPFELWVFVILLNGVWMVVPGLMIGQSVRALRRALQSVPASPALRREPSEAAAAASP
jgi:cholestenol delta-isomerase